ncbi:universal stress protein [Saccharothrix algeriensis]|uniref:Nucleotide-binding universal stress UspA family protein n=1 Tax=Saccharothrix algeriensis TaxID=173560 RepID=A0A8T8HZP7_9PSEU|nr:universal stress protein [Saccharothrix algeriensis]MBM7809708.1 nucleotide-binding universal stress UspA family protein [Saccharothrix algeriensis]QTR04002.1 universal stress protein [Saccharothrix algeriensis]
MGRTKKIVVGVDASPASADALEWAVRHAGDGTVQAVAVCRMHPDVCGDGNAFHTAHRRVLRTAVEKLDPAERARVEQVVVDGEPGPALVDLARDADTLVLGGHEYHRTDVAVVGSVVAYCVRHAPCPVVVVPVGAGGEGADARLHGAAREFR